MFGGLLGGALGPVAGLLGPVTSLLGPVTSALGPVTGTVQSVVDSVVDAAEGLAPGISHAGTLTGNIIGDLGAVEDVLTNLGEGDVGGAVLDTYSDVIGPGSIVNNLGEGGGLGIEGLLHGVLGAGDGLLG